MLVDCSTIVTADRVRLGCYGVNGGKAGQPFGVYIDAEGKNEKLGGLVDNVPMKAGELMRVRTTGGGGWGDPLDRDTAMVLHDVVQGKVSMHGARNDYGVVIVEGEDGPAIDTDATDSLRAEMRAARTEPLEMIDRGPGMSMFEKRP